MEFVWPIHPLVIASCVGAFGVGYIVRWALEEYYDTDMDDLIRRLFGRNR